MGSGESATLLSDLGRMSCIVRHMRADGKSVIIHVERLLYSSMIRGALGSYVGVIIAELFHHFQSRPRVGR